MRQLMLAAAVGSTALAAAFDTAAAQVGIDTPVGGVYIGPRYDRYDYYEPGYGYRSYRYYDDDAGEARALRRHRDRRVCGRNSHWNGEQCVVGRPY